MRSTEGEISPIPSLLYVSSPLSTFDRILFYASTNLGYRLGDHILAAHLYRFLHLRDTSKCQDNDTISNKIYKRIFKKYRYVRYFEHSLRLILNRTISGKKYVINNIFRLFFNQTHAPRNEKDV